MAAQAGVTLDKIVIEIESKSKGANKGIIDLTRALVELRSALKGGFHGLNKLSESLNELNRVSSKLPKTAANLASLSEVTKLMKGLSKIEKPLGLTSAIKNIEQIPDVFAKINPGTLENVFRVSSELAAALTPLANKMADIGYGFSKMQMMADRYGISVTKIKEKMRENNNENDKYEKGLRKISRALENAKRASGDFGRAGIKTFGKLHSKIKQVALSLVGTRTLFTAVRKAVSEYMQMDQQLTDATQNLWRALGAQLAPAIEYVIHIFTQIVRVIYSVIYALTGIDLIARANAKALQSMAKSAKNALGNLQKFDDLNTVDFGKDKEVPQIELDKIDLSPIQKVIDWMKKLKEEIKNALKTGDWGVVASTFFDGIGDGIDAIPWYKLGKKVREIIEKIPWKEIWDGIVDIAKESFKGLGEFINGLFNVQEDSSFGSDLLFSLLAIYGTIMLIKGANGLLGILEMLGLISAAPSLLTLGTIFGGILVIVLGIGKAISTWKTYLSDPTAENKMRLIFDVLLAIAAAVAGIAILFAAWPVAIGAAIAMIVILIAKFLAENWDTISKWFTDIFKAIGDWCKKYLIDPTVQSFKDFVNLLKMAWDSIVYNWKAFWNLMGNACKIAINGIIAVIEGLINGIISGINGLSSGLRKIGNKLFDIIGIDVTFNPISKIRIPRLETGTNEIPYEGIYHLHPGEAVVPKKYNPALGNGGSDETNQKLDTLIAIMNNMEFTNVVNIGNETLYKKQQRYNKMQNDKYGTTVNL